MAGLLVQSIGGTGRRGKWRQKQDTTGNVSHCPVTTIGTLLYTK